MRTTVVTGLLGSGKTTFIRNVLHGRQEKAVVLVNDFGQAGIDGEIISAGGIETVELPSGCVCCTLKFDLITWIQKIIKQFSPEHLLIEPSGVASPVGVLEALESAGVTSPSVVGIVDAVEFAELYGSGMYDSGIVRSVALYKKAGMFEGDPHISLVMGVASGQPAKPEWIPLLKAEMMPGTHWQVICVARTEVWDLQRKALEEGGNVRTGLEDTFYLPNGEKARSNGELVEALARITREEGREIATAEEARRILGIKN